MQLTITIQLGDRPLTLPKDHHHIMYSVFVELARDKYDLHEYGFRYGKRKYPLFTFGPIVGNSRKQTKNGKSMVTFTSEISIEFRAWDSDLVETIKEKAISEGVRFKNTIYQDVTCVVKDEAITSDYVIIEMISPICVYKTYEVDEGGKKHNKISYLKPFKPYIEEFENEVVQNFRRKYNAATGREPDSNIVFETVKVDRRTDKVDTYYKNRAGMMCAYGGIYRLKGAPEYLTLLYNSGLGAKNSNGFGMFKVL